MYPTLIAGLAMILCGLSGRLWASSFVPPKAKFGHIYGAILSASKSITCL